MASDAAHRDKLRSTLLVELSQRFADGAPRRRGGGCCKLRLIDPAGAPPPEFRHPLRVCSDRSVGSRPATTHRAKNEVPTLWRRSSVRPPTWRRKCCCCVAAAALAGGVLLWWLWPRTDYARQSARGAWRNRCPFSHQHHVAGLGHRLPLLPQPPSRSPRTRGLPPTYTCMTCHSQIWTNAALLAPVRDESRTAIADRLAARHRPARTTCTSITAFISPRAWGARAATAPSRRWRSPTRRRR